MTRKQFLLWMAACPLFAQRQPAERLAQNRLRTHQCGPTETLGLFPFAEGPSIELGMLRLDLIGGCA